MEFSRQKSWSRLPFPSPGGLPNPGVQPVSPALASRFFTTESLGKPGGGTPPAKNWDYCWKREKESWGSNFNLKRQGENTQVFMAVTSWCGGLIGPGGTSGKEPAWQCSRCKRQRFDPWVGRICWKRTWQPPPIGFTEWRNRSGSCSLGSLCQSGAGREGSDQAR